MAKKRGEKPCATGPIKFAHLCEIDARTKIGTDAWWRLNSAGARRVDVIRGMHEVYGSHEAANAVTNTGNIRGTHVKTMVRLVQEGNE